MDQCGFDFFDKPVNPRESWTLPPSQGRTPARYL